MLKLFNVYNQILCVHGESRQLLSQDSINTEQNIANEEVSWWRNNNAGVNKNNPVY